MRYSKEHKSESRNRILDAAAPLFRRFGIREVSVDRLMSAAELTRGGFYAHFSSKEALVEAILLRDSGLVRMMKDREGGDSATLNREAVKILSDYLDPDNLGEIVEGCPLATMPVDAARSPGKIRAAFSKRFNELVSQLRRGLTSSRRNEDAAIAAAVLSVGGVLLARACESEEDAARIERACRKHMTKLLQATDKDGAGTL